ncbi:MAG: hypothetical protein HWE26_13585 [Alteromonadaceae bacterium]|nr:hypothetical protein [Alteromonadaceae bacterium]
MALDAQGYFQYLRSYLNMEYYAVETNIHQELLLKEKIYIPEGEKNIEVKLFVDGDAFAIKLDKEKSRGQHHPLFHFLDNEGKPWSKRCDFIIFHLHKRKIKVYCLEFKYKSLPVDSIIAQLKSSEDWCRSLWSIINIYTAKKKRLNLTKYVLSFHENPERYLDDNNKYLTRDPSIRHYLYTELDGTNLHELEHVMVESIG